MKIAPLALAAALPLLLQASPGHATERLLRATNLITDDSSVVTLAQQTDASGLVSMVSSGLGITEQQSAGGLGALFNAARSQLGSNEFSQIAGAVPEMDDLLAAAPATENKSRLNGLLGKAGSIGGALNSASQLNSAFGQLGLSSDMIVPMANLAAQYLEGSNPTAAALLKQALGIQ